MPATLDKGIQTVHKYAIIQKRGSYPDKEILHYRLFDNVSDADLKRELQPLGLRTEFGNNDGIAYVILRERPRRIPRSIPPIHIWLFLATVITTLMAGALLRGFNVLAQPWTLIHGWPFSLTLLAILGFHEFGHYIYSHRHHVEVTLPYFIPVPPPLTFIGTFGAFIKMKGPIPNRLALLEIGAAGPIAGFIVAVPALFIGLALSTVVNLPSEGGFILGDSLLMKMATTTLFPGLGEHEDILLHPVAFAGWIGLLVTMLNLLPIAQLDGGHIAYALLGERQKIVGMVIFLALIPLGLFLSPNWLFWGFLILVLMRTVRHPPLHDVHRPLTRHEVRIGLLCLTIFILCFIPVPFRVV